MRVLQGAVTLSAGTLVVQASALLIQLLFTVWLSPADFGYWAAASSLVAVASGLVNLGEVNGYLANPGYTYMQARRAVWRVNCLLAVSGLAVAVFAWRTINADTAILVAALALNLPLLGYSSLLAAAYIRARRPRRVVVAQVIATAGRIVVGVAVAAMFESALAFGISTLFYSFCLSLYLRRKLKAEVLVESELEFAVTRRSKVKWAAYSLAQYMPGQVDYLVLTFATDSATLGIYYMAFQLTVGLSGLVAGPLSKTVLAGLSSEAESVQNEGFWSVTRLTVGAVIIAAALSAGLFLFIAPFIAPPWAQVPTIAAILLASLPARFLAPLTDARLMASGRWSTGILLCTLDTVGTGVAALSILIVDLEGLAFVIVAWKVVYGGVRLWLVADVRLRRWLGVMVPLAFATICICSAQFWRGGVYVTLGVAVVSGLVMIFADKVRLWFGHFTLLTRRT